MFKVKQVTSLAALLLCTSLLTIATVQGQSGAPSDPCAVVRCGYGARCQVVNGQAKCQCGSACPLYVKYVCGTDGKNYTNECFLKQATCKSQGKIQFDHDGPCSSNGSQQVPACATVCSLICNGQKVTKCVQPDGTTVNSPICHCPAKKSCSNQKACTREYKPVCGSDGKTYSNNCLFEQAACKNSSLTKSGDGACKSNTNTTVRPVSPIKGRPLCPNEVCTQQYEPVCGTDGVTYSNACYLQQQTCKSKGAIKEDHEGECDSNDGSSSGSGRPLCPNEVCTDQYEPVCGTDGVTYSNACFLQQQTCKTKGKVTEDHEGECDSDDSSSSSPRSGRPLCPSEVCTQQYQPVCGTDGVTYSNACYLQQQTCKSNGAIKEDHQGECESNGARSGPTRPLCPSEACTLEYEPVCGSDGKTYNNSCLLSQATCLSNGSVKFAYKGACKNGGAGDPIGAPIGKPSCQMACPAIYAPVCGSDGNDYSGSCELRIKNCQTGQNVTVKYDGTCKVPSCTNVCAIVCNNTQQQVTQCMQGAKTVPIPRCSCPLKPLPPTPPKDCSQYDPCPVNIQPICGSDNNTYASECELQKYACQQNLSLYQKHAGACNNNNGGDDDDEDDDSLDDDETCPKC